MASFNASLPANSTSDETAALSWQAADASAVSYRCRLGLAGGAPQQGPVQALQAAGPLPGPPLALGQRAPCVPPLQLSWLLPGARAELYTPVDTSTFILSLPFAQLLSFGGEVRRLMVPTLCVGWTSGLSLTLQYAGHPRWLATAQSGYGMSRCLDV